MRQERSILGSVARAGAPLLVAGVVAGLTGPPPAMAAAGRTAVTNGPGGAPAVVRRAVAVVRPGGGRAVAADRRVVERRPPERARQEGEQRQQHDKLDVNRATQEQLQTVPGIGPALARRIVEWRREHGPFETLEELLHVRGIGPRTLDRIRPYLEVRPAGGQRRGAAGNRPARTPRVP